MTIPLKNPWPLTIIEEPGDHTVDPDAKWLAFPCLPQGVPTEFQSGHVGDRKKWWKSQRAKLVGRGPTPTAALTDMVVRLDAAKCKLWRTVEDFGWPV